MDFDSNECNVTYSDWWNTRLLIGIRLTSITIVLCCCTHQIVYQSVNIMHLTLELLSVHQWSFKYHLRLSSNECMNGNCCLPIMLRFLYWHVTSTCSCIFNIGFDIFIVWLTFVLQHCDGSRVSVSYPISHPACNRIASAITCISSIHLWLPRGFVFRRDDANQSIVIEESSLVQFLC